MRFEQVKNYTVAKLIAPGDVRERQKTPEVIGLAKSMQELGGRPIHPLTLVRTKKGLQVKAGRNRFAAAMLNGAKLIPGQEVIEATELELFKLEIAENLWRRHDDKAALTAQLVDQAEAVLKRQASPKSADKPAHRPETTRGEARRVVAEATGDSVEAVARADQRAAAKEAQREAEGDPARDGEQAPAPKGGPAPTSPIDCFGHEMPPGLELSLSLPLKTFAELDKLLTRAQTVVADFGISTFSPGVAARIKQQLHDVAAYVRGRKPTHLCVYCLGASREPGGPKCGVCQEQGYITRDVFESAPREKRERAA